MSGLDHESLIHLGQERSLRFCCIGEEPRNAGNPEFGEDVKTFFVFRFCIIMIYERGVLMVINTLEIDVGETNCEGQKRNEMTWSRFYCMGSVLQVLSITIGLVGVVLWFVRLVDCFGWLVWLFGSFG
jgi:hypothetical protein